jgi:hypothetical protein
MWEWHGVLSHVPCRGRFLWRRNRWLLLWRQHVRQRRLPVRSGDLSEPGQELRLLARWLRRNPFLWDVRRGAGLHRRGRLLHPGNLREPEQELRRLAGYLRRHNAELRYMWHWSNPELRRRHLHHLRRRVSNILRPRSKVSQPSGRHDTLYEHQTHELRPRVLITCGLSR